MLGATTTKVTYSSDLDPDPKEFDQDADVLKTAPKPILDYLDEDYLAADLWAIAATGFAIDRNLRRPALNKWHKRQEWHREIRATIPVQNPRWWPSHLPKVEDLLNWLTADTWRLEVTQGRPLASQSALPINEDLGLKGRTALFSGGLDSVSGIIDDLETSRQPLHTVSVSTNNRMEDLQRKIFREVQRINPGLRSWFPFKLQVRLKNIESTARSRGFVFLAAGVLSAIARETNSLHLYENGPGALNLALSRGQVGTQSAKSVHPKTLAYMERLTEAITEERTFRIVNNAFTRTKAQMIKRVPPRYDSALASSVSCDTGFSHHEGRNPHCGGCTSCLLRRQALAAAGRNIPTPRRGTPQNKRGHKKLMSWQISRLHHVLREGPSWERMVREFPDLVCDPESFLPERREALLGIFEDYAKEWYFPAVIKEFTYEDL